MISKEFTRATLLSAMLALPSLAVNAQDNDVHAEREQTVAMVNKSETVSYAHIQVPYKDIRGVETDAVKASAAIQSDDAQVIVFFCNDPAVWDVTYAALQEVHGKGNTAFKGMYIADPMEVRYSENGYPVNSSQAIMIYADGQKTYTIENPDASIANTLISRLEHDFNQIIQPRRAAASNADKHAIAPE